jgi:hypothetical protein
LTDRVNIQRLISSGKNRLRLKCRLVGKTYVNRLENTVIAGNCGWGTRDSILRAYLTRLDREDSVHRNYSRSQINSISISSDRNDKSQFLAQGGFTQNNPADLEREIRQLIAENDAIEDRTDRFGTFYEVKGVLRGVNGINLGVVTIWLH